jgi:hypothetical protein
VVPGSTNRTIVVVAAVLMMMKSRRHYRQEEKRQEQDGQARPAFLESKGALTSQESIHRKVILIMKPLLPKVNLR